MIAQNFVSVIALTLLLGINANPLFRRSQQNGRGNIGSVVRDDSTNFDIENFGDSANNGVGNVVKTVAAAAGVSNSALARRSQGNSGGNIGRVLRDDSTNFKSKNLGDSANNGFFNVLDNVASASGVSNEVLARRSQVDGQGNIGSVVRDDSFNFQSKNFGDSLNNGVANAADSTVALSGVSNGFWKRSQVNSQGNIGSVVRDDSFNFQSKNFGDSLNNGVGNVAEAVAAAAGVSNSALARRSQGNSGGNIGRVLRDGSSNFKTENLGDSANSGLFNSLLNTAALSGVDNHSFSRRAQVARPGSFGSATNDKSNNLNLSIQGDATNNGWGNTLEVAESATGVSTDAPLSRRSIRDEDSSKNVVINDKSAKLAGFTENASFNQAVQGFGGPSSFWKRSISVKDSSVNDVWNDKSFKLATFTENDSLNQAAQGGLGRPFLAKRSIRDADSSTNVVHNDASAKVAELSENASVNQAFSNGFWGI